ncbi:uncharacterized protein LOC111378185 [Olea europaea var. sylvestris]|uniref:uncharacterized protein LOC111378185 n=1 Tax=Olea europaea var. sylvestris TaxID=158386 RepID=UPI000C1CDB46|nr:uncharacterized protein LOC111378185 [Olea europaea var. sylvestris]
MSLYKFRGFVGKISGYLAMEAKDLRLLKKLKDLRVFSFNLFQSGFVGKISGYLAMEAKDLRLLKKSKEFRGTSLSLIFCLIYGYTHLQNCYNFSFRFRWQNIWLFSNGSKGFEASKKIERQSQKKISSPSRDFLPKPYSFFLYRVFSFNLFQSGTSVYIMSNVNIHEDHEKEVDEIEEDNYKEALYENIRYLWMGIQAILYMINDYTNNMCCAHTTHSLTRQPKIRYGYDYIHKILKEDPENFRQVYRMYPNVFLKLSNIIREKGLLQDTRYICIEEMLATFLLIVGQNT